MRIRNLIAASLAALMALVSCDPLTDLGLPSIKVDGNGTIAFESAGGDQQITARIACDEIDLLLFFRDPMTAKSNEPNDLDMLRLCDIRGIPVATNIATAEVLIHGLERGDLDWRNIVNPRNR